jgi:pSer/pThr/pTyr-binding forkhead associated (FHA) protein
MAVLIGMSPEVKGRNHAIDKSPFTIGNATDNAILLSVPGVSGHHCEIVTGEDGKFTLIDKGSTNGTRVNNRDVTEHILHSGEIIAVGTVEFMFNNEAEDTGSGGGTASTPEIVEGTGSGARPAGFDSISPFGPRRREPTGRMATTLVILGIIAVVGIGYLLYKLFM